MEQDCLEQLESGQYSERALKEEIHRRFCETIIRLEDLDSAGSAQEALVSLNHCGYSFLEALYLLCGKDIRYCSLLSRRTLEFLQRFFKEEESEELKEPWEGQLDKIITDLDEKLLFEYFRADSKKLEKITFSVPKSSKPKSRKQQ